jgi:hypothetical protein
MKQWEMGRSQTPLPPERRAEVPWLFIRQQIVTGVLVCCTIQDRRPEPISPEPEWLQAQTARHRVFQVRMR